MTLKVQTKLGGVELTKTATKFEEGATIPANKFAIPADVKRSEGPDLQGVLERLKKGKRN